MTDSPFHISIGRIVKPAQIFIFGLLCPSCPRLKATSYLSHAFLCLPWLSLREAETLVRREEIISVRDPTPSWVHSPKPGTAAVKSASPPPFLLFCWGPWLLQLPLTSNPVESLILTAFFLIFIYNYIQVKQAAIAMSVGGKVGAVSLPFQRQQQWLLSNKNSLPYPPGPGLANSPD